ncbi:SbcC/MukB-like Walker B domain-containing protein [Microlunatus ginsengisoli]|uniref:SbcC/MukB-like Walker B domain-containing protein n=1 Tax=Microlunatus ginsengisoli TaxID=363863 RepID=UPI0031D9BD97
MEETLSGDGQVFEKAADYKEHIGRSLFGLDAHQYDEVLRLLYWLRQPQIGEDIEPAKLAEQLSQALPQLGEHDIRSAGDTFDELAAFGEQIERRSDAADALATLADAYTLYARAAAADAARRVVDTLREERRLRVAVRRGEEQLAAAEAACRRADDALRASQNGLAETEGRLRALETSPVARDQRRLSDLADTERSECATADRLAERLTRLTDAHRDRAAAVDRQAQAAQAELTHFTDLAAGLDRRQRESVPGSSIAIPPALIEERLADPARVDTLATALDAAGARLGAAQTEVRARAAAVAAVRDAVRQLDDARRQQAEAERRAVESEQRWETARGRRMDAQKTATAAETALAAELTRWATAPNAPAVDLPAELTRESLAILPDQARSAAQPGLAQHRADEQAAATRLDNARAALSRLGDVRAAVDADRDPEPPMSVLGRTERVDGHALWQLVDFAADLDDADRAGLEAALQGAGLLDAWLRPGGRLLDADQRDVVLAAAETTTANGRGSAAAAQSTVAADTGERPDPSTAGSGTLADLLRPDLPADSDLTADDVRRVLTAIRVDGDADTTARVGVDGSWRLGPARGRAAKQQAQYIGATARAEERARRLAALDSAIAIQEQSRTDAETDLQRSQANIAALDTWERSVPSPAPVLESWTQHQVLREQEDREESLNREAQHGAQQARNRAAGLWADLHQLADTHGLSSDDTALEAFGQRLNGLRTDLHDCAQLLPGLVSELRRWAHGHEQSRREGEELAVEEEESRVARDRAEQKRAELDALRETVGASVLELEQKVAAARESRTAHQAAIQAAQNARQQGSEARGTARESVRVGGLQLSEHTERRTAMLASFAALAIPSGLLSAAGIDSQDQHLIVTASQVTADMPVPLPLSRVADRISKLTTDELIPARNRVYAAHREASTGPAADHQPTIAPYDEWDLLAVVGRDDGGEAPIVDLARRVRASVDSDRGLLSEREKQQFEQHVLGELGDAIRQCRRDAAELVTAMNRLLGDVTTSQGIRVRLDWKLRDDVPPEARSAVHLLAQPVGALLPEERARLRDVLHRLIEASRAGRPDLSYGEHLAAALDYRTWSEFTIRYTRPEKPGVWDRLQRRSPLSQGEQKVLCYLPLFAAAAAHFTSLAGAAPYAPRLVLLDDAFPKIDVRTHPLLFGLLVQLELDFVITSERLWGDHDTLPALAIYEALRDPSQRGIAQYRYRWDGRVLHTVG